MPLSELDHLTCNLLDHCWPSLFRHMLFSSAPGLSHPLHELGNDHWWSQVASARAWWLSEQISSGLVIHFCLKYISTIFSSLSGQSFYQTFTLHLDLLWVTIVMFPPLLFMGSFCIIQRLCNFLRLILFLMLLSNFFTHILCPLIAEKDFMPYLFWSIFLQAWHHLFIFIYSCPFFLPIVCFL